MTPDVFNGLFILILGGLSLSAITGNVMMYRQIGELRVELRHLAVTLEKVAVSASDERREAREDHIVINARIDMLQAVPTNRKETP